MKLLSDDDLDLAEMSDEELAAAWDLWFDLAQATNDFDPPWTHGVFAGIREWHWESDVVPGSSRARRADESAETAAADDERR